MSNWYKSKLFDQEEWDVEKFAHTIKQVKTSPGFLFWVEYFKDRLITKHLETSYAIAEGQGTKATLATGAAKELEHLLALVDEQTQIAADLEKLDAEEEQQNGREGNG